MDLKPIVTCQGDKKVYNEFNPELERRLPETATEWRRSFGRPPKTVRLKARFVRLHESLLVGNFDNASSLARQPFFHMYWTDCQDADDYKSNVKGSITEWQRKLQDRGIVDWLIVQVLSQESGKGTKPKIQFPRGSVFDKIKSDFGGKNSDRIIQLWEPTKEALATRSVESWQALVTKLRQLLLISFNRHLGKFEDRVRGLRERRTEAHWSFTTYFLLHEELAFVFEMMGLYEEALIQYDEVDALLTQMIINSKYGEPLACIDIFLREAKCCDGVPMAQAPQEYLRVLIKTQDATFVDLRNYLFSRQCKLLLLLHRPWEIALRMLDFLHNFVHELEILKITMPPGGSACCVVLTVLEVLRACKSHYDAEDTMSYSLHVALLYQYAKKKLEDVGRMCGLMPNRAPSETELQTVCMLLSGIGKTQDEDGVDPWSPAKRLQEALSSKQAFESLYLELTELAIQIYKNIGRARSAKSLGMDLAQFYTSRGDYERAEPLLVDVYKMYKHERWTLLATQALMKLADCQKQLCFTEKHAYSCSVLACEQTLPADMMAHYAQELLQVIRDTLDLEQPIIIRAEPLLRVEDVQIKLLKGIGSVGEQINVELTLNSGLHEEVTCGRISFSLHTSDLRRGSSAYSSRRSLRANSPATVQDNSVLSPTALSEEDLSDQRSEDGTIDVVSVDEASPQHRLPRIDSAQSVLRSTEELVVRDEGEVDVSLECCRVPLRYGTNHFCLAVQVPEEGQYFLKQLCVEIGKLDFVWPQLSLPREARGFAIVSDPPKISWSRDDKEGTLLAGVPQRIKLTISVGPGSLAEGSILHVTSASGLHFFDVTSGTALVSSNLDTEDDKTPCTYKVVARPAHDDDDVMVAMVTLPPCGPYQKLEFEVVAQAPLTKQSLQKEVTEHQLSFCCKWLQPSSTSEIACAFHRPLTVSHTLHCCNDKRFVQTIVSGVNPVALRVNSVDLVTPNCTTMKTIPMHNDKPFIVENKQEISLLWRLEREQDADKIETLDCELHIHFLPNGEDASLESYDYIYDFHIEHSETLYTIQSRVEPSGSADKLTVGAMCKFSVTFTNVAIKGNATEGNATECNAMEGNAIQSKDKLRDLLYEIDVDTDLWMISGKNSGVITMPSVAMGTCDVTLDVMPLTGGKLPVPEVKLKAYERAENMENKVPQCNGEKDSSNSVKGKGEESSGSDRHQKSGKIQPKEPPVVRPLPCGQVYNYTQAIQVLVLPSNPETVSG